MEVAVRQNLLDPFEDRVDAPFRHCQSDSADMRSGEVGLDAEEDEHSGRFDVLGGSERKSNKAMQRGEAVLGVAR